MANVTATELGKGVRDPSYGPPAPGDEPPPFLAKPATVARTAVRRFHDSGAAAARTYLRNALSAELQHSNASMQGNARNTVNGLENYITADTADGRAFVRRDAKVDVTLPSGVVRTTVDVVVEDANGDLSGRAIYWDGGPISPVQAEVIAYPYADVMAALFPGRTITDICVWQARRDNIHSIPFQTAISNAAAADAVLANL